MTVRTAQNPGFPPYFDRMISSFESGGMSRHAHLGHWDNAVTNQDVDASELERAQIRLNRQMIQLAEVAPGTSILDVGCGFGGLAEQLDHSFEELDITGINIDWRQLEICQQLRPQTGNSLRWQEASSQALPFPDNDFDVVFCVEAMFHFDSRRDFFDEAARVLKPGGRLVVTDFSLSQPSAIPEFCVEALLNDGFGPWPDPWCRSGRAAEFLSTPVWTGQQQIDATRNTSPSYDAILPAGATEDCDPRDVSVRSALMLRWLHRNGGLRYEYLSATKAGAV